MTRPALRILTSVGGVLAAAWALHASGQVSIPRIRLSPFSPPLATVHIERERDYDLKHVKLWLKVDWAQKVFSGAVTHTLAPLRDGIREYRFDAGRNLEIRASTVDGKPASFQHDRDTLAVKLPEPIPSGQEATVSISYASRAGQQDRVETGFHWVETDRFEPQRKPGFWTNGWPEANRNWVPIYDYPNDKTTSETFVDVPRGWFVLSNGKLAGEKENRTAGTRTFHWVMPKPHSTYLLSLAGGEMDVVREKAGGLEFLYTVPRGEAGLVRPSYRRTPEMVRFFEKLFGVKYPWPKYGQASVFDFMFGGMENVGATTMAESALVEERNGPEMDGLVAHELAHQWFGNLVTYRDWSHAWVSEGFATFLTMAYMEKARGRDAYDRERESALQNYLREAQQYRRPIVTRTYARPHSMLDSHTYPKAALILHMLRRDLGDAAFFRSLGAFLRKHAYQPVGTEDFIRTVSDTTGRNLEPFFDQWIYRPGHPEIDYRWSYDSAARQVLLDVAQVHDARGGVPVYNLRVPVSLISGGNLIRREVTVNQVAQRFPLPADAPVTGVILDPEHVLLIERKPKRWQPGEALEWLKHAPCSLDRQAAALALLDPRAPDSAVSQVLDTVTADSSPALIASVLAQARGLGRPFLRPIFRKLVSHSDPGVRAAAITALGRIPADSADSAALRALVNPKQIFSVVTATLGTLGRWGADANLDLFERALKMESRHGVIRIAAIQALSNATSDRGLALLANSASPGNPRPVRRSAVETLGRSFQNRSPATQALVALIRDEDPQIRSRVFEALVSRKDRSALAALRALESGSSDTALRAQAKAAADSLEFG